MEDKITRLTEYRVYIGDTLDNSDLDHKPLKEVRQLLANPPDDLLLIEKVIRSWYASDGTMIDEKSITLFEKLN